MSDTTPTEIMTEAAKLVTSGTEVSAMAVVDKQCQALEAAGCIIVPKVATRDLLLRTVTYGDTQSITVIEDKKDWRYAGPGQSWSEEHWKPLIDVLLRAMTEADKDTGA